MKSIEAEITRLCLSPFSDDEKWRLIVKHKKALEMKIKLDPVRRIRKKVLVFMQREGITMKGIRAKPDENPFPIGRVNLDIVLSGGAISEKLTNKLSDFLKKEE